MRSVRVLPRRTNATPDDADAVVGFPGIFDRDIYEAQVSVTFTYDMPMAERIAESWTAVVQNVTIGGPALGQASGDFVPGKFLKRGYVITSRGCPNRCWFCSAWKREGGIRELPITDGYNVLDDNLLACSEQHIRNVFAMLQRQKEPAQFTGGLEAKRLQDWHVDLLYQTRVSQLFLAYDEEADYEPLVEASKKLFSVYTMASHKVRAYVLCGYPKDSFYSATKRMQQMLDIGVFPMAMLWRDEDGKTTSQWRQFQRQWARPHLVGAKSAALGGEGGRA